MDISLLLRVAGIGVLVSLTCQILSKIGKDEQALLVTVTGMLIVFFMLIGEIGTLISHVRDVFGL